MRLPIKEKYVARNNYLVENIPDIKLGVNVDYPYMRLKGVYVKTPQGGLIHFSGREVWGLHLLPYLLKLDKKSKEIRMLGEVVKVLDYYLHEMGNNINYRAGVMTGLIDLFVGGIFKGFIPKYIEDVYERIQRTGKVQDEYMSIVETAEYNDYLKLYGLAVVGKNYYTTEQATETINNSSKSHTARDLLNTIDKTINLSQIVDTVQQVEKEYTHRYLDSLEVIQKEVVNYRNNLAPSLNMLGVFNESQIATLVKDIEIYIRHVEEELQHITTLQPTIKEEQIGEGLIVIIKEDIEELKHLIELLEGGNVT